MNPIKKILFINPPTDLPYRISVQEPLGLLYLAAIVRQYNAKIEVKDLNTESQWLKSLNRIHPEDKFDIIAITSNISSTHNTVYIAKILKAKFPKAIVLVGGPHPTTSPESYDYQEIDYIVPFEGEIPLKLMMEGAPLNEQNGFYKPSNQLSLTYFQETLPHWVLSLDELPFPAHDLVDLKKYHINSQKSSFVASVITSRGCPSHCIFCSRAVSGTKWRSRSPENILTEIEWLVHKLGVNEISIEDDNFTNDLERASKICQLIIEKKLNIHIQLANGIRADKVTKELLILLKSAGCWKLAIAPETGNEILSKKIGKGIPLEQFEKVARWCKEIGLTYYAFFIIGFPYETPLMAKETINFAMRLDPLMMDLSRLVAFPGTPLKKMQNATLNLSPSYYNDQYKNEFDSIFRNAYLKFYLRPKKILEIIQVIGPKAFFRLIFFAFEIFVLNKFKKPSFPKHEAT